MDNTDMNSVMLVQKIQSMYEKYNRLAAANSTTDSPIQTRKIPFCRDITSMNIDILEKELMEINQAYIKLRDSNESSP